MRDQTIPIFMVVGPPAVGKSTTSRALAAHFAQSIHLPVDDIRHMVVSGVVLPSAQWSSALEQQITLARTCVTHAASMYRSAGFMVVIDDFLDPHFHLDYRLLLTHPQVHKVVLYPDQEIAHQRNIRRSGTSDATDYTAEGIGIVYHQLQGLLPQLAQDGWLIVDTTALNVEETVAAILHLTATGS